MAKSLTARLGLQRWTEDADTQDRTEFDGAHAQLEDLAAGFLRDLIANRPAAAAANAGFLFEDTDTGELYWSTGVAWLGPFATVGDLAHAHGLDDLSDVDTSTTAPVSGDLLTFNGSEWAPDSGSSLTTEGDLLTHDGDGDARLPVGSNDEILTVVEGVPSWAGAPSAGMTLEGSNTTEQSMSSTSAADLVTISGLSIAALKPMLIVVNFRADGNYGAVGLKLNAAIVYDPNPGSTAAPRIGNSNGTAIFYVSPREANYVANAGVVLAANINGVSLNANAAPTVPITAVVIRGAASSGVTVWVKDVRVYSLTDGS